MGFFSLQKRWLGAGRCQSILQIPVRAQVRRVSTEVNGKTDILTKIMRLPRVVVESPLPGLDPTLSRRLDYSPPEVPSV